MWSGVQHSSNVWNSAAAEEAGSIPFSLMWEMFSSDPYFLETHLKVASRRVWGCSYGAVLNHAVPFHCTKLKCSITVFGLIQDGRANRGQLQLNYFSGAHGNGAPAGCRLMVGTYCELFFNDIFLFIMFSCWCIDFEEERDCVTSCALGDAHGSLDGLYFTKRL